MTVSLSETKLKKNNIYLLVYRYMDSVYMSTYAHKWPVSEPAFDHTGS